MAAVGPIIAAAAAMRSQQEEEEEMTPYSAKDLAEGWEFKILRNVNGKFRDPFWLKAVLDEEARAGWVYLEKFDDNRIRLKRPASAREGDASLDFDPYRTFVGASQARFALYLLGGIFLGIAAGAALLVFLISRYG